MIEFLKEWGDYIATFFGTIVAAYVAIRLSRQQTKDKKLAYKVITSEDILSYSQDIQDNLEINYNNQRVDNLSLFIVSIINIGGIPIEKSDFEDRIYLEFDSNDAIVDAEVTNCKPKNLNIQIQEYQNSIGIEPCLINPKDKFDLKILLKNEVGNYSFDVRISGISEIEELKAEESESMSLNWMIYILLFFILLMIVLFIIK